MKETLTVNTEKKADIFRKNVSMKRAREVSAAETKKVEAERADIKQVFQAHQSAQMTTLAGLAEVQKNVQCLQSDVQVFQGFPKQQ